jgi:hypothetical protein
MDVARGFSVALLDRRGQRLDQRDRDIAGGHGRFAKSGDIEFVRPAAIADRLRRPFRDDAQRRFGARQRALDIEHPLQSGGVCHGRAHRCAGK